MGDVVPVGSGSPPSYYAALVAAGWKPVTLLASATYTDAEINAVKATVAGLGWAKQAMILLDLTDADTAAGDTLDVYIDTSPDEGSTWVNAIHFTQILGNGADALKFWAVLDPGGAPGTSVIAATSDAAAGVVRPSMFCDRLQVRHTVVDAGGGTQSFIYSVAAFLKA